MAELTRRRFLVRSSLGLSAAAAVAGALVGGPRLLAAAAPAPPADLAGAELAGPLVVHVRNAGTGEVSLMVGTTQTAFKDRDLVDRLLGAAARRGR